MLLESRSVERLREHVGPVFVGVDVLHLNLSLSDPFLHLEVAPLDVPGSREALAALGVFVHADWDGIWQIPSSSVGHGGVSGQRTRSAETKRH